MKERFPSIQFFDPMFEAPDNEDAYTLRDFWQIRNSDIVFAYMSAGNPSGYGLSVEIGYAAAFNKVIIFADERSPHDEPFKRWMGMCRAASTFHMNRLDEGLEVLGNTILYLEEL